MEVPAQESLFAESCVSLATPMPLHGHAQRVRSFAAVLARTAHFGQVKGQVRHIMCIQVRSMDGRRSVRVDNLSKLMHIEELRERLVEHFQAEPERQRLFYRGKQVWV